MNPYYDDEPPHAQRGQAKVPGGGAFGPSDDGYDPFDPFADSHGSASGAASGSGHTSSAGYGGGYDGGGYPGGGHDAGGYDARGRGNDRYEANYESGPARGAASPSGRASVPPPGSGSAGRASVRPAAGRDAFDDGFDPFGGEAPGPKGAGAASVGSAAVGAAPVGSAPAGRASVGAAAGRAGVGRASVPGPDGPGGPSRPGGGRPGGPGGPGGSRPGAPDAGGSKKAKKSKRRNRILAASAALTILLGMLVIGFAYYSASVPLPTDFSVPQATTIYYSDGKTEMARIGDQNRQIIPLSQVPVGVQHAVVATEDETFYTNSGYDLKGILRAFVNNVKGGDTQGASTITQQYARAVAKLTYSASYSRKLREIIIAYKMSKKYTKSQILEDYLNTVLFGRNAYGIQAAAKAYFNKNASELTTEEGMVLAGLIKNPNGGLYDPSKNLPSAQSRWNYTRTQMIKLHFVTPEQGAAMKYPTDYKKDSSDALANVMTTPEGFIVHHVLSELSTATKDGVPIFPKSEIDGDTGLKNGGYKIITTIDKTTQQALDKYANPANPNSPLHGVKKNIGAAVVAVQPGTGKVLAYYGGEHGSGLDRAGIYADPVTGDGTLTGLSQTPGSSFKTITMATALQQGLSVNSYWYGPEEFQPKDRKAPVHNVTGEYCPGAQHICTMQVGLKKSLNTMYYQIGEYQNKAKGITMTPGKIVDMAYNLGIQHIWPQQSCKETGGKRIDLKSGDGAHWTENGCITPEVSFGQFNVTVQDLANVMATYAASGVRATEHFVDKVIKPQPGGQDQTKYLASWDSRLVPVPGMSAQRWADLNWAMQTVYQNSDQQDNQLADRRPAAGKTGTWQLPSDESENGWVVFNGYTAHGDKPPGSDGQIAVTSMITYTGDKPEPLEYTNGKNLSSAGAPAKLWQLVVDSYENHGPGGKPYPVLDFPPRGNFGDPNIGGAESPAPPTQPANPPCFNPGNCGPGNGPSQPPGGNPPGGNPPPQPPPASQLTGNVTKTNDSPMKVRASWDNSTAGSVNINWGDGQTDNGLGAQGIKSHMYSTPGTYTVTITDSDDPSRSISRTVS